MGRKIWRGKKLVYVHIWGKNEKKYYIFFKFEIEIALNCYLEKFHN